MRQMGTHVGSVGDIDGDGGAELAVQAAVGNGAEVWLYFSDRAKGRLELSNPYVIGSVSDPWSVLGDGFGDVGDVDGDGYDDLVIADSVNGGDGQVLEYLGGPGGPSPVPTLQIFSGGVGVFGTDVSPLGDANGDGYADVAFGSTWWYSYSMGGPGYASPGAVYVHFGGPGGLPATADLSYVGALTPGDDYDMRIGDEVTGLGDVNGDGYDDMAMQGSHATVAEGGIGNVQVFYGSTAGFAAVPDLVIDGDPAAVTYLGPRILALGDLDGDGFDDAALGTWEGEYEIHLGGAAGLDPVALQAFDLGTTDDLVPVGDMTGDGYPDVAWADDTTRDVCLFAGSATGFDTTTCAVVFPGAGTVVTGHTVAGRAAIAVGDPDASGGGRVRVVVGH
jgi:hypothetical protein